MNTWTTDQQSRPSVACGVDVTGAPVASEIIAAGAPDGPVASCHEVDDGGEQFRFGSIWAPGDCTVTEIAGGTGRTLVCKGGAGDDTCSAASD